MEDYIFKMSDYEHLRKDGDKFDSQKELEKIFKMNRREAKEYLQSLDTTKYLSVMEAQLDFQDPQENCSNSNNESLSQKSLKSLNTTEYLSVMEDQLEGYR